MRRSREPQLFLANIGLIVVLVSGWLPWPDTAERIGMVIGALLLTVAGLWLIAAIREDGLFR